MAKVVAYGKMLFVWWIKSPKRYIDYSVGQSMLPHARKRKRYNQLGGAGSESSIIGYQVLKEYSGRSRGSQPTRHRSSSRTIRERAR